MRQECRPRQRNRLSDRSHSQPPEPFCPKLTNGLAYSRNVYRPLLNLEWVMRPSEPASARANRVDVNMPAPLYL